MSKRDGKPYYVYNVYYRGILVYIGKGIGKRWKHVANGGSSNEIINDFYFRNKYLKDINLDVRISKYFETDEQAKKEEKKQILKFKPLCNKVSGRVSVSEYSFEEKLAEVSKLLGKDTPEFLWSKFDFSFLFTPKGLLCSDTTLSNNSVFERTDEEYFIRIKKECYKYFPEYFIRFNQFDPELSTDFLSYFGVRNSYIQSLEKGLVNLSDYGDLDWHIKAIDSCHFKYTSSNAREFDVKKYLNVINKDTETPK